ncbi:hypothetical protein C7S16_4671 [Burkholderia thailandensis]|uniref:Uncharacterized protein n=1 Tax=Burkholderia thailandensis TaxID=57975 RepID=A0AAW9CRS5_BURTH|nr:hypothetical protein [Burkholderia thailandensis]MDW9252331.1 hypothetical protein [Burkholderia thailandensis]
MAKDESAARAAADTAILKDARERAGAAAERRARPRFSAAFSS